MIKVKIQQLFLVSLCIFGIILIFLKNKYSMAGVETGLILCSSVLIPSLFPFMVLSSFMVKSGVSSILSWLFYPFTKWLFGLPPSSGAAIFMGFIGGYPIGASGANNLYKNGHISKSDAQKMLYFCVNAGPAFIVLAVGLGMFRSIQLGLLLLTSLILSSILLGILCNIFLPKEKPAAENTKNQSQPTNIMDAFVEATAESANTILQICGFTVLFSAMIAAISSLPIPNPLGELSRSILEVTNGCAFASKSSVLPLAAGILGFGGISVHCQIFVVARDIRPSYTKFLIARIISALLSALFIIPLEHLFPVAKDVFSNSVKPLPVFVSYSVQSSIALILMCIVFLFSINNKTKISPLDFIKKL